MVMLIGLLFLPVPTNAVMWACTGTVTGNIAPNSYCSTTTACPGGTNSPGGCIDCVCQSGLWQQWCGRTCSSSPGGTCCSMNGCQTSCVDMWCTPCDNIVQTCPDGVTSKSCENTCSVGSCNSCTPDMSSCPPVVCGDGTCNGGESCSSCFADCGACIVCGDGSCNGGEECGTTDNYPECNDDCGVCPPPPPPPPVCGDGTCNGGESCSSCFADCGACEYCGDGTCDGTEDCGDTNNAPECNADCGACPYCGDGTCNGDETCSTCSDDCGSCVCNSDADCNDNNVCTSDTCLSPGHGSSCRNTPISPTQIIVKSVTPSSPISLDADEQFTVTSTVEDNCGNQFTSGGVYYNIVDSTAACETQTYTAQLSHIGKGVWQESVNAPSISGTYQVCIKASSESIACSSAADCDDGYAYTADVCLNPETGSSSCEYTPIVCNFDADCDDLDISTTDTCVNPGTVSSSCTNTPIAAPEPGIPAFDTEGYRSGAYVVQSNPAQTLSNDGLYGSIRVHDAWVAQWENGNFIWDFGESYNGVFNIKWYGQAQGNYGWSTDVTFTISASNDLNTWTTIRQIKLTTPNSLTSTYTDSITGTYRYIKADIYSTKRGMCGHCYLYVDYVEAT